ncbi:pyridoxal-phosphate dependent enzyme [Rathayibacter soli]|uniref:pyridoxal-phosphate dependent enzyme n=1 Tax=Rathayibacter soli TaxID=3144168 RepID=UPI0027E4612F|nr:pyridoxal-phosphate dependent enzyme [Glaciibacter superstes]
MTDTSVTDKWYITENARTQDYVTPAVPREITDFHVQLPGYQSTELRECPELAAGLGVGRVFVKEEAERFGLPSFKMVGASWAVYQTLVARTEDPDRGWTFDELATRFGGDAGLTLVCATDGNHGRAVAHMARLLRLDAHIFVPAQIGQRAKDGILGEGATLTECDAPYDDVVAQARAAAAADPQAILVQDTAWDGYEQIPAWIVDGYSTIFREIDAQLADVGVAGPDVVVTPCGVGSLIQACAAHYRGTDRGANATRPTLISVEPRDAACLIESLSAGHPVAVATGQTRMAGMNCGTVSTIAWPILKQSIDIAVAVTDEEDEQAVHDLERLGVDSGPCGAAALAGLRVALGNAAIRARLGDISGKVIVLLSTESRTANPLVQ